MSNKNSKFPNWLKTVLGIFIILILIGACSGNGETPTNDNKSNSSTKEKNIKKNTKQVFKWECTGDITHEGIEETKKLEVGKDLDAGEYIIKYKFKDFTDSFGQQTTNKFNRYYFVFVSNVNVPDVNGESVNNIEPILQSFTFAPNSYLETKHDITVENGNYIYIHHTKNEKAGYGTLTIYKK